ncbi:probable receptor-like protein kinase At5g38990 [Lotus japonicus]|uniref:probable receptor-like protein kinase At5g38990 n=1 Tax=Lotus japonicus TaxID=34305 RepID=UPI002588B597|nr:probable receptor-like protein kinase At5g38990 [Lotus japonicus]
MVLKFLGFGRSKKHSSSSKKPCPTVIEELCTRFSLADLEKATNNFDEKNVIGQGAFCKVYKGYLKIDHVATAVAVKRRGILLRQQGEEPFKMETKLLCQLRHPNLITLIGFCFDDDEKIIVYEYMSNGSLTDRVLSKDAREPLSWKTRLEICIGAARAVHYIHSGLKRTIIHRRVNPSNILLDDNMVPKLSDFGISIQGQLFTEKPKPIEGKPPAGTFGYMPPEGLSQEILTDKFDVYSFGVVLLEVVCAKRLGRFIYETSDCEEIETSNNGSESPSHITDNGSESPSHITDHGSESPSHITDHGSESPYHITDHHITDHIMLKLQAEEIDPALVGNIAPECYAVYIDIIDRCLKHEPDERPTMGEVEVLLEHALTLQLVEDARDTSDDYL